MCAKVKFFALELKKRIKTAAVKLFHDNIFFIKKIVGINL